MDSVPNQEWRDTFEWKWKSSADFWDRKLLLIRDKVKLITSTDGFVEKLEWVKKTIDATNLAIKEQRRVIEKEKEMIRNAVARQPFQNDMSRNEIILDTLKRRFSM